MSMIDDPERSVKYFLLMLVKLSLWKGNGYYLLLNMGLAIYHLVERQRWKSWERAPWGQKLSGTRDTEKK